MTWVFALAGIALGKHRICERAFQINARPCASRLPSVQCTPSHTPQPRSNSTTFSTFLFTRNFSNLRDAQGERCHDPSSDSLPRAILYLRIPKLVRIELHNSKINKHSSFFSQDTHDALLTAPRHQTLLPQTQVTIISSITQYLPLGISTLQFFTQLHPITAPNPYIKLLIIILSC